MEKRRKFLTNVVGYAVVMFVVRGAFHLLFDSEEHYEFLEEIIGAVVIGTVLALFNRYEERNGLK